MIMAVLKREISTESLDISYSINNRTYTNKRILDFVFPCSVMIS